MASGRGNGIMLLVDKTCDNPNQTSTHKPANDKYISRHNFQIIRKKLYL